MKVELMPQQSATDRDMTYLGVKISALERVVGDEVLRAVVRIVAERYVEAHYADIIKTLDPQAIANLAIADAGKKIAEAIQVKVTREETESIVNQVLRKLPTGA